MLYSIDTGIVDVNSFHKTISPSDSIYINIDSLLIRWHDGSYSKKYNILKDTLTSININDESLLSSINIENDKKVFSDLSNQYINHVHKENNFVDFDRDRLLFHMSSSEGSCICEGDINNDGFNDLYIGGAKGSPGSMYLYNNSKFDWQKKHLENQTGTINSHKPVKIRKTNIKKNYETWK